MKKHRVLGTFVVVLLVGTLGSLIFWVLRATGRIRIKGNGYGYFVRHLLKGRLIIAANHPSLLETGILPLLSWPFALWLRCFPWSLPDNTLFRTWQPKVRWLSWLPRLQQYLKLTLPAAFEWVLNGYAHCIPVDRKNRGSNSKMIARVSKILTNYGTVIWHPEAGRTDSQDKLNPEKKHKVKHVDGRSVRKIRAVGLVRTARQTDAFVMPLYVDINFGEGINGFSDTLRAWLKEGRPVTLYVGDVYQVEKSLTDKKANKELRKRIISAGLPAE